MIFRKNHGRRPISATFVFLPFLILDHVVFLYNRRRSRPWDELSPGVLLGRRAGRAEVRRLIETGVSAVLDLTAEFDESAPFRRLAYLNIPVLDLTSPSIEQLRDAVTFVSAHQNPGVVYIHCKLGVSRTACIAAAWLLAEGKATTTLQAIDAVRHVRPQSRFSPATREVLRRFH